MAASAKPTSELLLLAGSGNPQLAQAISKQVGVPLSPMKVKRFADGEVFVQVDVPIRGKDIFIIQPTSPPVNENMMELLFTLSTCRRASAGKITAVVPYYGYARQDRKLHSRTPISAADVARMMCSMGVDRVMSVDLHSGQIQGFFPPTVPMDNLTSQDIGVQAFIKRLQEAPSDAPVCVVSPDAGGVYRAKLFQAAFSKRMPERRCLLATMIKHRPEANKIDRMDLVGDVSGCDAIIVDDMCDTGGTLCAAAKELQEHGAKRVFSFITHAVFSGPALERVSKSIMDRVFISDSIAKNDEDIDRWPGLREKLHIVSLAGLLGDAIKRVHANQSLSDVFHT